MTIARLLALPLLAAVACSASEAAVHDGVDPSELGEDGGGADARPSSSSGGSSGASSSSSSSGSEPAVDLDAPAPLAEVTIARVWAMQAVAIPVAEDGIALPNDVPVIAGRDLTVRVFLAADAAPRAVEVEVLVERAGAAPQIFATPWTTQSTPGYQAVLDSTPLVRIPQVEPGMRWSVRVVQPGASVVAPGTMHAARYPQDGTRLALALPVPTPKVVIVPFRWDVDGSGRLPDTSPAAMDALRNQLRAWYPVSDVDLQLHAVVPYDPSPSQDGDVDFYDVNDVLYELRAAEAPAADVYYYGLLAPAASFDDYCTNVCTTGQSYTVKNVEDADIRVGAGVAFTKEGAANTFAHELGHLFGRGHSPCNVTSWDPDYPHAGGRIGLWGWSGAALSDPAETTDFMGYCDDQWVSDYTYRGLHQRLLDLQAAQNPLLPARAAGRTRLVHVHDDGRVTLGRSVAHADPRAREGRATVRWLDEAGQPLGEFTVRAERIGHDGATLFVPEVPGGVRVDRVQLIR